MNNYKLNKVMWELLKWTTYIILLFKVPLTAGPYMTSFTIFLQTASLSIYS